VKWNSRAKVPKLGKGAIERGNTDGGLSKPLLFKHKSGRISFGSAYMHEGKVIEWFPGEVGDDNHVPESKDCEDPIVLWTECPNALEIVEAMEGMGC
jgi:hypothetical protein